MLFQRWYFITIAVFLFHQRKRLHYLEIKENVSELSPQINCESFKSCKSIIYRKECKISQNVLQRELNSSADKVPILGDLPE